MISIDRDVLCQLADSHGVAHTYQDYQDITRHVSDETLIAVLAALGVHAEDTDAARARLDEARNEPWLRLIDPTVVHTRFSDAAIVVTVPAENGQPTVEVHCEDGWVCDVTYVSGTEDRDVAGVLRRRYFLTLPEEIPDGYHSITVTSGGQSETATLLAVPGALPNHPAFDRQRHGMAVQLYSVTSSSSWGMGDFADLRDLAAWSAGRGADFVLINPVHAPSPVVPVEPSPYLPTTRRFYSPMYVRVEDIREYAYLPHNDLQRFWWVEHDLSAEVGRTDMIHRDNVWEAKRDALYTVFSAGRSLSRQAEFERFRDERGESLEEFATWSALSEHLGDDAGAWPEGAEGPNAPGIGAWREKLSDEITFHCWLQWVCEEQLRAAHDGAKDAGMAIGVIHDLAVGVHPVGADAWALGTSLARGVTVGAPPDGFNQQGQDWSQPPWRPDGLAKTGYAAVRDVVRAALRYAGGVRMDHAMGMFRLWWIPAGKPASEGTYVYYNDEAMLGVVCLEAARTGAIVVGEDLGTVEPRVREQLAQRDFLGTNILWFEQNNNALIPAEQWRRNCLATVTTHDLPPTASYLQGSHVDLRESLGLLTRPVEEERVAARAEVDTVLNGLRGLGVLGEGADEKEIIEALHVFLTRTPSLLIAWSLTDAVGDRRTQNQPGTFDEYPNWRMALTGPGGESVMVDDLPNNSRAAALLDAINNPNH